MNAFLRNSDYRCKTVPLHHHTEKKWQKQEKEECRNKRGYPRNKRINCGV